MFQGRLDRSEKGKTMALTEFQITILRLLSEQRKRAGISYIAGGAALNEALKASRRSNDIDIFHDTAEALRTTWDADRKTLLSAGYSLDIVRENPTFIEVVAGKNKDNVLIQWVRDSAFRFFPLIEDVVLGLTLHPFDLATNKVLAMAGRLEPRDWIDTIECHRSLQPFGYLLWAATGKDPGINPDMIISEAARLHYSQAEIDGLDFGPTRFSARELGLEWKQIVNAGKNLVDVLPVENIGACLLKKGTCTLYTGTVEQVEQDLADGNILFHQGTIGGAWPEVLRRI